MNEMDEKTTQPDGSAAQPEPRGGMSGSDRDTDRFFEERLNRMGPLPTQPSISYDPFATRPRKSKFAAGLLAFLIPGTGHFYLGLMQRGLFVMLALIADIYAIVHTTMSARGEVNVPLVTLFGLLIPVIYFYNIFDALQSTDAVNAKWRASGDGVPDSGSALGAQGALSSGEGRWKRANLGWLLVAGGCLVLLLSNKPAWMAQLYESAGSYMGAVVLIAAGVYLFLKDSRK